ncbi:hypothetical protein C8Q72DRAFT_794337 [Fomitopsis betulina]|nr:hypothetical protein C8Q72DRAFT_794337 [Fomitopsis betulina]
MSEGSLATVVDKSRPQSFDHASKSPDATPEAKPRPWEQKMYPCLKTHRYDRGTKLDNGADIEWWSRELSAFKYTVRPLQTQYLLEDVPEGWDAIVHPEGSLYFWDRAHMCLLHRTHCVPNILMEAFLCDPEVLNKIEDFAACLYKVARDGDMTHLGLSSSSNWKQTPPTTQKPRITGHTTL